MELVVTPATASRPIAVDGLDEQDQRGTAFGVRVEVRRQTFRVKGIGPLEHYVWG
jgi:hypothetical protein